MLYIYILYVSYILEYTYIHTNIRIYVHRMLYIYIYTSYTSMYTFALHKWYPPAAGIEAAVKYTAMFNGAPTVTASVARLGPRKP